MPGSEDQTLKKAIENTVEEARLPSLEAAVRLRSAISRMRAALDQMSRTDSISALPRFARAYAEADEELMAAEREVKAEGRVFQRAVTVRDRA